MISGVCRFCGCTTRRACSLPSGETCAWIDQEETLCSGCVARLSEVELQELWLQEFVPYAAHPMPPIQIDTVTAFSLVAALQLAMKHPQIAERCKHGAGFAREFADAIGECLGEVGPLTAEVIRRGFVGCYQPPEPQTQSEPVRMIIIPGEG